MARFASVVLWLLVACGPLSPARPDGGGGGAATGGGLSSGGGLATGGGTATGGGVTGGGAATGGAGPGTGGGAQPPRVFQSVILPTCAAGLSSKMNGLAQDSLGNVYAATDHGCVYRIAPGAQPSLVVQVVDGSAGAYFQDLTLDSNGVLYAPTVVDAWTCSSACDQQASWRKLSVAGAGESLASVCNSSTGVWAFGGKGSFDDGAAWQLHPTGFDPLMSLSASKLTGCWTSGGQVYVAGRDAVVHLALGFAVETATATSAQQTWRGGGMVNGTPTLAGMSSALTGGLLASRDVLGIWKTSFDAMTPTTLSRVVGVSATEAWAFGSTSASFGGQIAWEWDGATWAPANPDVPSLRHVGAALLSNDDVIWVAGDDASGHPVLLRGAR